MQPMMHGSGPRCTGATPVAIDHDEIARFGGRSACQLECAIDARISGNHHEHGHRNLGRGSVDGSDARLDRARFVAGRNGHNDLLMSHTDLTDGSRSQNRNWRHVLMKFVAVDFLASSVK